MDDLGNDKIGRDEWHDPVSAISEAEATGETAAIFADIRQTMQIPLITSIWRTLVDIEGGLRAMWEIARPLYETGQPAAALSRLQRCQTSSGSYSCYNWKQEHTPTNRFDD